MSKDGLPPPPWSRGGFEEPYTEPKDPWGDHPTAGPDPVWGAHPASMPPATASSATYEAPQPPLPGPMPPATGSAPTYEAPHPYGGASALNAAPPPWGQPHAPPRRRNAPIIALVLVLGLLICGGLGTTAWLFNRQSKNTATPAPSQSAPPADDVLVPGPRSSEDARFVSKGQCIRNEGTATKPTMKITPCASGTLEVLKRVDGRTTGEADAEGKCSKEPNYTKWFFYDSELDSLDFVLCLRER
jgi:hypothetical protein